MKQTMSVRGLRLLLGAIYLKNSNQFIDTKKQKSDLSNEEQFINQV